MKHILLLTMILLITAITGFPGELHAGDCKVSCKNGTCEVKNCDANAICKCNWLGNPVCKCKKKGIIEEIGDIADNILTATIY